jgi:hypothetical protein
MWASIRAISASSAILARFDAVQSAVSRKESAGEQEGSGWKEVKREGVMRIVDEVAGDRDREIVYTG